MCELRRSGAALQKYSGTPPKGPGNASQPKGIAVLGICGVIGPSGFDTAALIRDFPSMIALTVALYIMARSLNRVGPGRVSRRSGH